MKKSRVIGFLACAGLGLLFFKCTDSLAVTSSNVENASQAVEKAEKQDIKKIALTFDDGPHPYYTEQLLDGLKERGVVATFFVTGEHVELHRETIARMAQEGHLIGNHTYSHMQLTADNKEEFKAELIKTNEVICEITGQEVLYAERSGLRSLAEPIQSGGIQSPDVPGDACGTEGRLGTAGGDDPNH